ncbi:TRAP-type C4-dicarboxylate transport system, small permease component [Tritonibacter multivorans]|uniref:TRAP transporter small permease protein n=1 Tax=Tritonibacter multivorans TaxID=928856 RepID=A0A0P1G4X8_9RHOB|nr:TRAP transporter small permease [Tritonibacter multivorans]MDA7421803.1 TRAP transporter small permease [Tritonibacter multivorans]CUH76848.1 TRAP-type C4-dicarboxylate transport system, small permease component [Tritonibacter multivorans]SFD05982.1 TRAP-type C4-dicarboxylate transport system, small permease component [Tritonibacter multivorans]
MARISDVLPRVLGVPLLGSLRLMRWIVILSGALMSVTFFLVVVIRYGFNGDLFAYEEWLLAVCFWGFFAGSALASEGGHHINADILSIVIKNPRLRWWRRLVVLTIEFLVTAAILYWGYLMLAEEIGKYPIWKVTPALKIPYFTWRLAIFLGFFFMTAFSAAYLYAHIRGIKVDYGDDIEPSDQPSKKEAAQ